MLRFALLIAICALPAGAAAYGRIPREHWIDPDKAVSPVRLADGTCLDLRALPDGWKVSSASNTEGAQFGLPGSVDLKTLPRFRLMIGIGGEAAGLGGYRSYAQGWAEAGRPRPSENDPALDVGRFRGYPADDGETVYVSEDLDALNGMWTPPRLHHPRRRAAASSRGVRDDGGRPKGGRRRARARSTDRP